MEAKNPGENFRDFESKEKQQTSFFKTIRRCFCFESSILRTLPLPQVLVFWGLESDHRENLRFSVKNYKKG